MIFRSESAVEYFKDLVDAALAHQRITAGELTAFYVVNLLASFVHRTAGDDHRALARSQDEQSHGQMARDGLRRNMKRAVSWRSEAACRCRR